MVKITFPDGSVRSYEQGVTGLQIAESLSPALARDVVSCGINGETTELNRPINEDASINLYKFSDDEGKHTFWHTSAHLLAEALQELYPGIQFGFGPAVENGFFYDVMPANGQGDLGERLPEDRGQDARAGQEKTSPWCAARCRRPTLSRSSRPWVRTTRWSTSTWTWRTERSLLIRRAASLTSAAARTWYRRVPSRPSR